MLTLPQEAALLQPQPVEINSSELEADMEQGADDDTADSDIAPAPAAANLALSPLPATSTLFTADEALAADQDPTAAANAALDTQQQAEEAEQAPTVAHLSELPIAGGSDLGAALKEQAECVRQPNEGVEYNKVHLPDLHIEFEIRSPRPRAQSDITIVSQLSLDRLEVLGHQCTAWGGVTSAAVYLPLLVEHTPQQQAASLAAARATLTDFHAATEAAGGCRLDLVLAAEHLREAMLFAYPYNALRNTALLRAATDAVLLLDVDFSPSASLHERLTASSPALLTDLSRYRHAIVLPAFETGPDLTLEEGHAVAAAAVTGSKANLLKMFRSRQIIQFAEFYPAGHKPTKYATWFNASAPYPVRYKMGYEPYILVARTQVPLYDERFRGYGFDKVMHIWQMHTQWFQFMTHPSAFVVHRPHAPSAGYKATFKGPAYSTKHRGTAHLWAMEALSKDMIREVKAHTYAPAGVSAIAHCRPMPTVPPRADAWW
mmetsp:Transcript_16225/g.48603  ORF Transcript_16225/g.48603 Transcript_16225/m.48603 type:complete len:489 (+) Transcript_16225:2030-3496(+)